MKKITLLLFLAIIMSTGLMAGGIQTNANQSARYTRTMMRDASLGVDAVYYNPAGLSRLNEGFHISLNNQTIFQKREIKSNYEFLNTDLFKGEVTAPIFPGIYVAYKTGKFTFSGGFNPIGGGGSADYANGTPDFEIPISDLVPGLNPTNDPTGVTDYRLDAALEGKSVYFGTQVGVTYQINDMISVFGGIRYITAKNSYNGHLKDIDIFNVGNSGEWMSASEYFGQNSQNFNGLAMGLGAQNPNDPIDPSTNPQAYGTLQALGYDPSNLTNQYGAAILAGYADEFDKRSQILADQEVDVEQTGTGITPIFGANIMLMEDKLNIGIKYEMKTEIKVKNDTKMDFLTGFDSDGNEITMFPNGEEISGDLPAMLSIGVGYDVNEKLRAMVGYHYYFDKSANYGKKMLDSVSGEKVYVENDKVIDDNYYELGVSLEYKINEKLTASAGFLRAVTGVNADLYQTDLSYSISSNSIGGGFGYKLNDKFEFNLGCSYTMYEESIKSFVHGSPIDNSDITVKNTYWKDALIIGIGVDISL